MLIIFDLDGTLFQTKPCDIAAVNHLFEELELKKIENNVIINNIGKRTSEFLTSILPDNIKQQDVCERFRKLERIEVRENGILFPGIVDLIEKLLLKGHILNICSNGSLEYIGIVLEKTGITKYFSKVYSAKEFSNKAEVIQTISSNNHKAVVIGDTISDI